MTKTRGGVGVVVGLLLVVTIAYIGWSDHLPPDSPLKHARRVAGLPIPSEAVVENTDEPHGLIPNSYFNATFRLTPKQFQALEQSAEESGYHRMPVVPTDAALHQFLAAHSGAASSGWYLVESRGERYRFIILDARQLTLYVQADAG
jgi:hypothetical protein